LWYSIFLNSLFPDLYHLFLRKGKVKNLKSATKKWLDLLALFIQNLLAFFILGQIQWFKGLFKCSWVKKRMFYNEFNNEYKKLSLLKYFTRKISTPRCKNNQPSSPVSLGFTEGMLPLPPNKWNSLKKKSTKWNPIPWSGKGNFLFLFRLNQSEPTDNML